MSKQAPKNSAHPIKTSLKTQKCPKCGQKIGILAGSVDAICVNCGYKDPCCE